MKKFRNLMALLIAMVMVVGTAATVSAATITMQTLDGHTYEIFQVFTGTVDEDGKTLTELKYGASAKGTQGEFLSPADLKALKDLQDRNLTDEHQIIDEYSAFVDFTKPYKTVEGGDASDDLAPGYYVIRDVDNTVPADKPEDTVTLYMFQVLNESISISAKAGTVESKKKVQDINDSTETELTGLQDSADYEIGDEIPYTLTFKLPDNYSKFEKYYVQFSDDMDKGLTLITNSVKIQYGSADATSITFTEAGASTKYTGGKLYTYEIEDLKTTAPALQAGDTITITYKAYLNEDAKYGVAGNPNTYKVKFNNNPNNSGKGKPTGDTPEDTNIVFTYKAEFDKIDENKKPLEGADFILEKQLADGSWVDVTTLGGTDDKRPMKVGDSASKSTTFEFKGLDDGVYRLTESYTPEGYNTIAPLVFTITASHQIEADNPELVSLAAEGANITMSADKATGTIKASIENKSGAVLPTTGGVGTTMFYVIGAILVVGAGVVLVSRRRMSA